MSFTPEELAEMARADAEIEREFILTDEEAAESRELDRAALMARKDKQAKAVAERQRRYYEANKAKWKDYNARQKAKKAALLREQEDGQPEGPATNTSQV